MKNNEVYRLSEQDLRDMIQGTINMLLLEDGGNANPHSTARQRAEERRKKQPHSPKKGGFFSFDAKGTTYADSDENGNVYFDFLGTQTMYKNFDNLLALINKLPKYIYGIWAIEEEIHIRAAFYSGIGQVRQDQKAKNYGYYNAKRGDTYKDDNYRYQTLNPGDSIKPRGRTAPPSTSGSVGMRGVGVPGVPQGIPVPVNQSYIEDFNKNVLGDEGYSPMSRRINESAAGLITRAAQKIFNVGLKCVKRISLKKVGETVGTFAGYGALYALPTITNCENWYQETCRFIVGTNRALKDVPPEEWSNYPFWAKRLSPSVVYNEYRKLYSNLGILTSYLKDHPEIIGLETALGLTPEEIEAVAKDPEGFYATFTKIVKEKLPEIEGQGLFVTDSTFNLASITEMILETVFTSAAGPAAPVVAALTFLNTFAYDGAKKERYFINFINKVENAVGQAMPLILEVLGLDEKMLIRGAAIDVDQKNFFARSEYQNFISKSQPSMEDYRQRIGSKKPGDEGWMSYQEYCQKKREEMDNVISQHPEWQQYVPKPGTVQKNN